MIDKSIIEKRRQVAALQNVTLALSYTSKLHSGVYFFIPLCFYPFPSFRPLFLPRPFRPSKNSLTFPFSLIFNFV